MLKVAADADAFGVNIERGLGGSGELVAEGHLLIDPFDNRMDAAAALAADGRRGRGRSARSRSTSQ